MEKKTGGYNGVKIERFVSAFLITTSIFVAYCLLYYKISADTEFENFNIDVALYMIGLAGYICCFIVCLYFLQRENTLKKILIIANLALPLAIITWLAVHYLFEVNEMASMAVNYLRHNIVFSKFYFLFILCGSVMMTSMKITIENKRSIRMAMGFVCILTEFLVLFHPNILADEMGMSTHQIAYSTTVISTVDFQPYSSINYSIYGHYGLFYIIPVKIMTFLGLNQWLSINICIAAFGAAYMGCIIYIVHRVIKNTSVFLMTAFLVLLPSVTVYATGAYYQLHPHRMLFPAIVTAIIIRLRGGTDKAYLKKFIIHIVFVLSLLWNLETGVVCCVAFVGYSFFVRLKKNSLIENIFFVVLDIFLVFLDLGAAYETTNLYNNFAGGCRNTFREFIYPFLSNEYLVNDLRVPIGDISNIWFIETIVFAATISIGIGIYLSQSEVKEPSFLSMFFMALIGAGLMVDYINRSAATNATLPYAYFAIIVGYFYDNITSKYFNVSGIVKVLFERLSVLLRQMLLLASITCVVYMGVTFQRRSEGGWNMNEMENVAALVEEHVPRETLAMGGELPAIYSMLGWKPKLYTVDIGDMTVNSEAKNILFNRARKEGVVLTDKYFFSYYRDENLEGFELIEEIGDYALYSVK